MAAAEADQSADLEEVWAVPLKAADSAKRRSRAVLDEVIRDASAAGLNPTQIARQLGTADRRHIYEVNNAPRDDSGLQRPPLPCVVFLRGAKVSQAVWDPIKRAMWRRGWHTTMSRADAWHLARGRVPLILVDFSARSSGDVKIGVVRAVYGEDGQTELPLAAGGSIPAPRGTDGELDPEALARAVQEVIGHSTTR